MKLNIKALLLVASLMITSWGTWWVTDSKWTKEVQSDYISKLEATERTRSEVQKGVNEVSKKYQEDLAALEGSTDRIINDLHNDGKLLRVKLAATNRELKDNGGCLIDGKAELDREFAERLIRVTQRGDVWIEALQNTIRELQQQKENK
ncbi:MAG: hypothetical protein [Caudoviricetes sp.]|nr:MAG: hypothetical protein [Caudoviricetes sp.]